MAQKLGLSQVLYTLQLHSYGVEGECLASNDDDPRKTLGQNT